MYVCVYIYIYIHTYAHMYTCIMSRNGCDEDTRDGPKGAPFRATIMGTSYGFVTIIIVMMIIIIIISSSSSSSSSSSK